MRVCVLGHRGMLGHMVARYLKDMGHEILTITKNYQPEHDHEFTESLLATQPDWCINCIGVGPHAGIDPGLMFAVNAELPATLVKNLPASIRFIQASTDGVFKPDQPNRIASDIPDASDDYGVSKQRAETAVLAAQRHVIRCSIIGTELATSRNLLSWFLSQNECVQGYTNQSWNGVTTLEWAKCCDRVMKEPGRIGAKLLQPGFMPACSKFELLGSIAQVWKHDIRIDSGVSRLPVARTLVPNFPSPPLVQQLTELHEYR